MRGTFKVCACCGDLYWLPSKQSGFRDPIRVLAAFEVEEEDDGAPLSGLSRKSAAPRQGLSNAKLR